MSSAPGKSLYQRLGGYDAICAAVDDLIPRLHSDPQLGSYWKGQSQETKRKGRQLIVDYLCQAAGGPTFYTGGDMKTMHTGLHISESDWKVFMAHSAAMLGHLGVAQNEKEEVVSFLESLKGDIVEKALG